MSDTARGRTSSRQVALLALHWLAGLQHAENHQAGARPGAQAHLRPQVRRCVWQAGANGETDV